MKFYLDESACVEQQLAYAAETGLVFFTHDIRDYLRLAREWAVTGRRHAGIVLSHQHPLDELVHRFRVFRHRHGSADLGNKVLWLPALDLLSPPIDT